MKIFKDSPLFIVLIRRYTIAFFCAVLVIACMKWIYFVNLKIHLKPGLETIIWILFFCPISYVLFNSLSKTLNFKKKNFFIRTFLLIPGSFAIAGINTANYLVDRSYTIVVVEKPSEILNMPDERFFKINAMKVLPDNYYLLKEHHSFDRHGDLEYTNCYLVPIYDDIAHSDTLPSSAIAYGVTFKKKFYKSGISSYESSNDWHTIDTTQIAEFNTKSEIDYNLYDFNGADYFERVLNSNTAFLNYKKAWAFNKYFDQKRSPTVLEKRNGTLNEVVKRDLHDLIWAVILSYLVIIILLRYEEYDKNIEILGYTLKE
jgi:hypothetical protein